jgi:hypothetical protein
VIISEVCGIKYLELVRFVLQIQEGSWYKLVIISEVCVTNSGRFVV